MRNDLTWLFSEGAYAPKRDPRADDPDYYYRLGQGWIKKIVWTVDNEPSCQDREMYRRFLEETTNEERLAIRAERRRRFDEDQKAKGFVRWQDAWVTPERREVLKKTYEENMRRSTAGLQLARQMRSGSDVWFWC